MVAQGKYVVVGQEYVKKHGIPLVTPDTPVILDIDLDFFGCDSPTVSMVKAGVPKHMMQQLQKAASRVIWLNPLAGSPGYQAEVTGMKAALPFIDIFAAAHNVESLRKVAPLLRKGRIRPNS
jgi:hypothetical protein